MDLAALIDRPTAHCCHWMLHVIVVLEQEVRAYDNEDAKMAASANTAASELAEKKPGTRPAPVFERLSSDCRHSEKNEINVGKLALFSNTRKTGCMNVACLGE